MLMLCWLYCVPFLAFMYYATAPLIIMLSCFIFKRGLCRDILWLRVLALWLIFISCYKIFLIDLQEEVKGDLFYSGLSFTLFIILSGIIYAIYKKFDKNYKAIKIIKKDDKELCIWANTALTTTVVLICWELFPWVGYLSVGKAPEIFTIISWRLIAAFNFVTLLAGFWQSEEYYSYYNEIKKGKKLGMTKLWVPSDTLWLTLPLFLIALAFGIMGDDILHKG